VEQVNLGLYEGYLPTMVEKIEKPVLRWHGSRIPRHLWQAVCSFMRWTQETYSSEAQLRLYYNEQHHHWKAVVLPQTVRTGMTSNEIPNHVKRQDILMLVNPEAGWKPAGTVHHHCTASAFQSGTDYKDEIEQNGLHVTLGHMLSEKLDVHARATFRRCQYEVDLSEWIDGPVNPPVSVFPARWKTVLEEPAPVTYATWNPTYNTDHRTRQPGYGQFSTGARKHYGWDDCYDTHEFDLEAYYGVQREPTVSPAHPLPAAPAASVTSATDEDAARDAYEYVTEAWNELTDRADTFTQINELLPHLGAKLDDDEELAEYIADAKTLFEDIALIGRTHGVPLTTMLKDLGTMAVMLADGRADCREALEDMRDAMDVLTSYNDAVQDVGEFGLEFQEHCLINITK
jgi:hypothetical protein